MKKEIFLPRGFYSSYSSSYESFRKVVRIIDEYFLTGGYNYSTVLKERMIAFYGTLIEESFPCKNCKLKSECHGKVINLTCDDKDYIPIEFYNWKTSPEFKREGIIIKVNNRPAGCYCIMFKSLILTDWLFNSNTTQITKKILPRLLRILEKKYGLTKLNCEDDTQEEVEITIGADPEFEQLEDPNRYIVVRSKYKGYSKIGCDGSQNQIELRPDPAKSPEELVENIKKLINQIDVPITVIGNVYPLGAHIHFGFEPKDIIKNKIDYLVDALDDFLGIPMLELNGDARGRYGRLSDYEIKDWGFEYRTLPSSYLIDPEIATIVFKIAYNVVKNLIKHKKIEYNIEKIKIGINGEEVEIPDKNSYMEIAGITEDEYDTFVNFLRSYKKERFEVISINEKWMEGNSISIRFHDTWEEKNLLAFHEIFLNMLNEKLEELNLNSVILKLVFYGLNRERGLVVAGFKSSIYETIPHPGHMYIPKNWIYYGLPWEFRNENISEETLKKVANEIIEDIMAKIKQINKNNNKEVAACAS